MPTISVTVKNKIATGDGSKIVCGNSDYTVSFTFDSEWDGVTSKTMRVQHGATYTDVVFTGTTATLPVQSDVTGIKIGVFAGNLRTTTPAYFDCVKSILCAGGSPVAPTPSVYNQIMAILNGFSASVSKTGDTATITIVDPEGTTTVQITDGDSPTLAVSDISGGHRITITDIDGTRTVDVMDGEDGADGENGVGISSIVFKETTAAGNVYTVKMTDGTTYEITAPKGAPGTTEWNDITGKPSTFPPSTHNHDERYYTEAEVSALIAAITALIPSQATAQNQLADKDFTNSSIATNTAYYISNNGEPFTSVAQLEAYSGTVTNNDYAFVTGTDESGNTYYDRYKATVNGSTVTWAKEFRLNNSSFTALQWAAITSGITAALVSQIGINQQNITTILSDYLKAADLANYVQKTDYATSSTGGVIKVSADRGTSTFNGVLTTVTKTYSQYQGMGALGYVGKGTLENVANARGWTTAIKTTMDATAVANTQYYLGQQSALSFALPASASAGQEITVVFYSGATATTLSVTGSVLGTVPTPAANQRVELNFLWDGVNWFALSNVIGVTE